MEKCLKASPAHALAALLMLLFAPPAGAPIMGIFSGLSDLMRASDAIVIGLVMTGPATLIPSMFDDSRTETVFVAEVLKGNIEPRAKLRVRLRKLNLLGDDGFRMGRNYMLFLQRDYTGLHLVNVSGSAFPIAAYRKRSPSHDGDVRGYIAQLLNDLVSERKERAAVIEQQVTEYLSLP